MLNQVHAKLTGGGGTGGCLIGFYIPEDGGNQETLEGLKTALEQKGFSLYQLEPDKNGLII